MPKVGWVDFLKGIFPEKFININIDNRKIEIKDSTIIFGDQVVKDKDVVDKLYKELEKYKEKDALPAQIVHKEIEDDYLEIEDISIKNKDGLEKLKEVLPLSEVECILMARRVVLAHEAGNQNLFNELMNQLDKHHPKNGRKVYNLICGGYFDELIMPFIDIIKSEHKEKHVEKFRSFYFDLMRFFPVAVFVGNNTTEDVLERQIAQRLSLKDIPFIRIHAMGSQNIVKVVTVVDKMNLDGMSIQDNRHTTPFGLKAQILEIKFR